VLRAIDLVLRFVYVAIVPFILINMTAIMPISGILIGAALATAVALFGSAQWRERVSTVPVAGKFLANMARLGEYYEERPPRPLLFYIFYPLVLPYVLANKSARREFLLFRRLNVVTLVILVITNGYEYVAHWYPDLPFGTFAGTVIGVLILQILVAAMFVMPIVTTIILLHQRDNRRTLGALLVCVALFTGLGTYRMIKREQLSAYASARLYARTRTHRAESRKALERGLEAMAAWIVVHRDDDAGARERAVEALESFYAHDEAAAFHLLVDRHVVLLVAQAGFRAAIWLGYSKKQFVDDPAQLSAPVRKALRLD
jgi:hypothetical protein